MDILEALFEGFSGSAPSSCVPLAASGSNRKYYRLTGEGLSVVGVIGTDPDENRAFMALSRHFRDKGLNVPEVLASSADSMAYIQTDLGMSGFMTPYPPEGKPGTIPRRRNGCSAAPWPCSRISNGAGPKAWISGYAIPSRPSTAAL